MNHAVADGLAGHRVPADEAARLDQVAFAREVRVLELEQEVNALCERQGEAARYPVARDHATINTHAEASAERSGEHLAPLESILVLVVDDNVDAAQSLAILLTASGHQVRLVYDGPAALDAILDDRPDVVLLDIGLPGLDGFEVATQIRQQDTLKNIMLVALTGYGQERDRQRSYDVGFDHHLVKPADYGELQKILATVAERAT